MSLIERLRDAGEERAAAREELAVTVVDPDVDVPYVLELSPALAGRLQRYLQEEIPTFRARFAAEVAWLRLASIAEPDRPAGAVGAFGDDAAAGRLHGDTDCRNCGGVGSVTRVDLTFGTVWVACPDCGFRWGVAVEPG
ncbi:MAG: zinc finger-like domain-containing protein [Acidimicrobiales bacterium]|jgi:hypothetical protein|nr:zinc finger-like domain-containing protein [Acidimicrobiales bacterium]